MTHHLKCFIVKFNENKKQKTNKPKNGVSLGPFKT